jgi:hypothetical protein
MRFIFCCPDMAQGGRSVLAVVLRVGGVVEEEYVFSEVST